MADEIGPKQRQLVRTIAASLNAAEKKALTVWIDRLLALKAGHLPPVEKARRAIELTAESKVIVSIVKMTFMELKRIGWDERGIKARGAIVGAAIGLLAFGSQGAGIAALGTAIGVPLWVVFGAGGAFLALLYEELTGRKPRTTYTVIDAEKKDHRQGR